MENIFSCRQLIDGFAQSPYAEKISITIAGYPQYIELYPQFTPTSKIDVSALTRAALR
jgi:hypothetical protein